MTYERPISGWPFPAACLHWFLLLQAASGATLHTDDFQNAGQNGWTGGAFGGQALSKQQSGGPAGAGDAFLQAQTSASNLATYNSTPVWTGDFEQIDASRVAVDLMNASGSDELAMRVVLFGPASLGNRWTSTTSAVVPADGVWRRYEFSLSEANLTLAQGVAFYDDLMNGVVRIMLRHDPGMPSAAGTPVTAILGIDNVSLMEAPEQLPGDYNDNGLVDSADYAVWRSAYGGVDLVADGNKDGEVNAADYTVWRDNLQALLANNGGVSSAPEPRSAMVVCVGFVTITASSGCRLRCWTICE